MDSEADPAPQSAELQQTLQWLDLPVRQFDIALCEATLSDRIAALEEQLSALQSARQTSLAKLEEYRTYFDSSLWSLFEGAKKQASKESAAIREDFFAALLELREANRSVQTVILFWIPLIETWQMLPMIDDSSPALTLSSGDGSFAVVEATSAFDLPVPSSWNTQVEASASTMLSTGGQAFSSGYGAVSGTQETDLLFVLLVITRRQMLLLPQQNMHFLQNHPKYCLANSLCQPGDVPTYGGVDLGGARGPMPNGGEAMNRAMAEGRDLLNGVVNGGPFEGVQEVWMGSLVWRCLRWWEPELDGLLAEGNVGVNAGPIAAAVPQLTDQRNALVAALQARAARMVQDGVGDSPGAVSVESGEMVEHNGEQMDPLPSKNSNLDYCRDFLERMNNSPDYLQGSLVNIQVVQEEVRRAVQQAMQQRDHRVNDLQAENAELRQLLASMMEVNTDVPNFRVVLQVYLYQLEGEQDRWINEPAGRRLSGGGQSDATGKPQGYQEQGASLGAQADGHRQDDGRAQPAPMDLLAEGIKQLQQLQLRRDGHDPEILKGSVELPKLPEPYQDQSAIAFLEWIYEVGQVVGSITDKAAGWWSANVELAMEAYHRFQAEVPLKRLHVQALESPEVDPEKWARLERRVMTLLLSAMSPTIKAEITMLRINRVKDCLFKLYTTFAPSWRGE
ncbi:GIP [Symbiodinium sp. CCMP2592]|nr:GIP [Symbiodinium sp. CCMP2592]